MFLIDNFLIYSTVIQNKYRSYCESKKRIKTSIDGSSDATTSQSDDGQRDMKEPIVNVNGLKRTYSQSTQNQAARKIQQFMLTAKNK